MRVRGLLLLVLVSMLLMATGCVAFFVPAQAEYGAEISFAPGRAVLYPDFTLDYIGQHRVVVDKYPRGFLFYDFRISRGDVTQDVAWTDGTGAIEPADFAFGGAPYTLEVTDRSGMEPFTMGRLVVQKVESQ